VRWKNWNFNNAEVFIKFKTLIIYQHANRIKAGRKEIAHHPAALDQTGVTHPALVGGRCFADIVCGKHWVNYNVSDSDISYV
jgi:hypothetical protein